VGVALRLLLADDGKLTEEAPSPVPLESSSKRADDRGVVPLLAALVPTALVPSASRERRGGGGVRGRVGGGRLRLAEDGRLEEVL